MTSPSHNEDSHFVSTNLSNEVLGIVADGMGGHNAGEVASQMAVSFFGILWAKMDSIGTKQDAINWIKKNVNEVNEEIYKTAQEKIECQGMGTTLVLVMTGNRQF